jgi:hypothetical protein
VFNDNETDLDLLGFDDQVDDLCAGVTDPTMLPERAREAPIGQHPQRPGDRRRDCVAGGALGARGRTSLVPRRQRVCRTSNRSRCVLLGERGDGSLRPGTARHRVAAEPRGLGAGRAVRRSSARPNVPAIFNRLSRGSRGCGIGISTRSDRWWGGTRAPCSRDLRSPLWFSAREGASGDSGASGP